MHLKITKNKYKGEVREYVNIVQSYRANNKVKHRQVFKFGRIISEKDRVKANKILDSLRQGNEFVNMRDIKTESVKEFGVSYLATELLKKYGIGDVLKKFLAENRARFDVYGLVKALVVNRLVKPSSDLSAYEWIQDHYCERLDIGEHHVYGALDHLIKKKKQIEVELFNTFKKCLKLKTGRTYYDLTSSYFEGGCCEIALFGHSRDRRRDRQQIVIGIVMCDGIPVMHEVFEGNTSDVTTLEMMQKKLSERLGIKRTIFVADNGLVSKKNIEFLESKKGYQYILRYAKRQNNIAEELIIKPISSKENQYAREVKGIIVGKRKTVRRYILCLDKNTRKQRLKELVRIKKNLETKLTELQGKYKRSQKKGAKGKKMTRDSLMSQASKCLGRNKRLFEIKFDKGLIYNLNEKSWTYEKKIAGKFLLVTTTKLEPQEVMKAYKELQSVENAFDEIKNFLNIRPIGHWKTRRVKAHVFICVLAFLIECLVERFCSQTARKTLNRLKTLKAVDIHLGNDKKRMITKISSQTEKIFKQLKIQKPIKIQP